MPPFWVSRGAFQAALKMNPAKLDYWHGRSMMCSCEDKPAEISRAAGLGFGSRDKPGYEARRRPLFHLPPTIKGTTGLRKGRVNGHKRAGGARGIDGGDDKVFSESVPRWVSAGRTDRRDKVTFGRGQAVDLPPRGCALICWAVGSGLKPGRRPQRA